MHATAGYADAGGQGQACEDAACQRDLQSKLVVVVKQLVGYSTPYALAAVGIATSHVSRGLGVSGSPRSHAGITVGRVVYPDGPANHVGVRSVYMYMHSRWMTGTAYR